MKLTNIPERTVPAPIRLDPEQQAAVDHQDGPCIVASGPGSGKTRIITSRVERLLREGVPPERLFVTTFTNMAATEMLSRISKRIGRRTRGIWCGTFHGLCVRILRAIETDVQRAGRTRTFSILDAERSRSVFKTCVLQVAEESFSPTEYDEWEKSFDLRLARETLSLAKQEGKAPDDVKDEFDRRVWLEYDEALGTMDCFDFDDLLVVTARYLETEEAAAWRSRFRYVLVDEYQDTNGVQVRIAKALASNGNLFACSDLDQSLYSWRGADPTNVLRFATEFLGAKQLIVPTNYRSTSNIVTACQAIIERNEARIPKVMKSVGAPGEPVVIRVYTEGHLEACGVGNELAIAAREKVPLSELAVLYRTRRQSRVFEEQVRGLGLPYRVVGAARFYERSEVMDCVSWLRIIAFPVSDVDFVRAVCAPPRKIARKTLAKLTRMARENHLSVWDTAEAVTRGTLPFPENKKGILSGFLTYLSHRKEMLEVGGAPLVDWVAETLQEAGIKHYYETHGDAKDREERPGNVDEVVSAVMQYAERAREKEETPTIAGYLDEVAALSAFDDASKDAKERVSLLTIHAAKGLEFERVWLVGCEAGKMPSVRSTTPAQLEEERRCMFVACSRAKRRLTISYAKARGNRAYGYVKCDPSPFLYDIPPEVSEWRDGSSVS